MCVCEAHKIDRKILSSFRVIDVLSLIKFNAFLFRSLLAMRVHRGFVVFFIAFKLVVSLVPYVYDYR